VEEQEKAEICSFSRAYKEKQQFHFLIFSEKEAPAGHGTHDPRHATGLARVVQELTYIEHRIDQELYFLARLTGESSLSARLNWLAFRPPPRYPDNFTISLEDTPQFYKDDFINNIPILIAFSKYVDSPGKKDICIDDLKEAIQKLPGFVSVPDLVAMGHRPSYGQRIFMDNSSDYIAGTMKYFYQAQLKKLHKSRPSHPSNTRSDKKERVIYPVPSLIA
jgi:hypothetical protein